MTGCGLPGGMKMDAMEQRRNTIVDLVNQSGNISFAQLKKKFPQISEMTLRTDLKALDEVFPHPADLE